MPLVHCVIKNIFQGPGNELGTDSQEVNEKSSVYYKVLTF